MDLCSVGDYRAAPCYVVRMAGVTLLLDCGLDLTTLGYFPPRTAVETVSLKTPGSKELSSASCKPNDLSSTRSPFCASPPTLDFFDPSSIDAVLLSSSQYMLALPYLIQNEKFRGRVLATPPSLQLGRLMMEELAQYNAGLDSDVSLDDAFFRQLPVEVQEGIRTKKWRPIYSMEDIATAIQRVELVSYGQSVDLFGLLEVTPFSSGASLGSCNWVVQTSFDKFVYLSASSQLTTHPKAIQQGMLQHADVLLISGISLTPTLNPDSMIHAICKEITSTLRNEGNVLFPVSPTGVVYDILECLYTYMEQQGHGAVPIFFISPVSDASLAFSNSFGEWVCTSKQNRLYQPEPPFIHADLVKQNRLKFFLNIHGGFNNAFRSPCVVFAGHPSLRLGDAVHFMRLWGSSRRNTVILTEPEYANPGTLAPFQPLAMRTCIHPIDTRLNFHQANRLLQELKPTQLVSPDALFQAPVHQPDRVDLSLDKDIAKCVPMANGEVVNLALQSTYQRAMLSLEVAGSLDFTECQPAVYAASLSATLTTENNRHQIVRAGNTAHFQGIGHEVGQKSGSTPDAHTDGQATGEEPMDTGSDATARRAVAGKRAWAGGNLSVERLREALSQRGFTPAVKTTPGSCLITLVQDQREVARIQLGEGSTHVTCLEDSALPSVREALQEQFRMF